MKNWLATFYNYKNKIISSCFIFDRTEHEAENESNAFITDNCEDWTLTEITFEKPILEILQRKKEGIDCTEEESAELKGFLRENYLTDSVEKSLVFDEIEKLFPQEYEEFVNETI